MQKCQIVRDRTAAEDIYSQGISRLRYALPFSVLITAFLTSFGGLDEDELSFEPSLTSCFAIRAPSGGAFISRCLERYAGQTPLGAEKRSRKRFHVSG
jgi:hypothetical protein